MKISVKGWRFQALQKKIARAFTLVELLLVVVIIGILIAVTTPFIISAITATRLTSAGEQMMSLFSLANQIASSEGRAVEVRLVSTVDKEDPSATATYRTVFIMRRFEAGEASPALSAKAAPLEQPLSLISGEVLRLPEGIVISSATAGSSVMSRQSAGDNLAPQALKNGVIQPYVFQDEPKDFVTIVFNPDGTNLPTNEKWFITVAEQSETLKNPSTPASWKNFYCIQIDPVNARVTAYRP